MRQEGKIFQTQFKAKLKSMISTHPSESIHFRELVNLLSHHNILLQSKTQILKLSKLFDNPLKLCRIQAPLSYLQLTSIRSSSAKTYYVVKVQSFRVHRQFSESLSSNHQKSFCLDYFVKKMKKHFGSQNNWFRQLGGNSISVSIDFSTFKKNVSKILVNSSHQHCLNQIIGSFIKVNKVQCSLEVKVRFIFNSSPRQSNNCYRKRIKAQEKQQKMVTLLNSFYKLQNLWCLAQIQQQQDLHWKKDLSIPSILHLNFEGKKVSRQNEIKRKLMNQIITFQFLHKNVLCTIKSHLDPSQLDPLLIGIQGQIKVFSVGDQKLVKKLIDSKFTAHLGIKSIPFLKTVTFNLHLRLKKNSLLLKKIRVRWMTMLLLLKINQVYKQKFDLYIILSSQISLILSISIEINKSITIHYSILFDQGLYYPILPGYFLGQGSIHLDYSILDQNFGPSHLGLNQAPIHFDYFLTNLGLEGSVPIHLDLVRSLVPDFHPNLDQDSVPIPLDYCHSNLDLDSVPIPLDYCHSNLDLDSVPILLDYFHPSSLGCFLLDQSCFGSIHPDFPNYLSSDHLGTQLKAVIFLHFSQHQQDQRILYQQFDTVFCMVRILVQLIQINSTLSNQVIS